MKRNKVESTMFFLAVIFMLILITYGAWQAQTQYGYGVAALFGGLVLIAIGNYQIHSPIRIKFCNAIRIAKSKSRFWWVPYAGITVAMAGAILLLISGDATRLEELLGVLLVTVTFFYSMQLLPEDSANEERAM